MNSLHRTREDLLLFRRQTMRGEEETHLIVLFFLLSLFSRIFFIKVRTNWSIPKIETNSNGICNGTRNSPANIRIWPSNNCWAIQVSAPCPPSWTLTFVSSLLAEHEHLLERTFTVRFRCLLDNTSGFVVSRRNSFLFANHRATFFFLRRWKSTDESEFSTDRNRRTRSTIIARWRCSASPVRSDRRLSSKFLNERVCSNRNIV